MQDSGCNFLGYQIGGDTANDGYILRADGRQFTWSFGERGNIEQIETFDTEVAADLTSALEGRGITFLQECISYGSKCDPRYPIFVHGTYAEAVSELSAQFHQID